jgi:hypothetical protein
VRVSDVGFGGSPKHLFAHEKHETTRKFVGREGLGHVIYFSECKTSSTWYAMFRNDFASIRRRASSNEPPTKGSEEKSVEFAEKGADVYLNA